jgi:hypothetical protein
VGSRRWIRFPVHTAFFGMFLLLPHMSAELLLLGIVLNIYNVIGSILYDKRLITLAGDAYRPYLDVTGLIWPPVYRAPRGAADLPMAAPQHWRKPSMHIPGLLMGVALGFIYVGLVGRSEAKPGSMFMTGLAGLIGAVVTGLVLGRVLRPKSDDWGQQQTDMSTTVALAAATGVVTWVSYEWIATGTPPAFAAYLPLWFTVQYLGHVFAFLADRKKWSAAIVPAVPAQQVDIRAAAAPVAAGGRVSS